MEKEFIRMAKKELVIPVYGKKRMVRHNAPAIAKYKFIKKVENKDQDLMKYFGDDVDFTEIKDGRSPEEIEGNVLRIEGWEGK